VKTAGVYRWELRKLAAQKRTYAGLGAAAIYALAFVIVLTIKTRNSLPSDGTADLRSRRCCSSSRRSSERRS